VIHWDGGRHHALRSRAVGYCYLADIPLSILSLLGEFKRVLYVDLDAHHGDGVEFAFNRTEKVVTLSFHVYEPGFFPGTGSGEEAGKGVYNVPLERGMKGVVWEEVVKRGVEMIVEKYDPECFVVQCGCDGTLFRLNEADEGLVTDPHRALQLTTCSFQRVMSFILTLRGERPMLLLGGGGYHAPSTAKHFTLLTALVLGQTLSDDIPLEAEYWEELERDGGIHVGRDTHELDSKGKEEADRLCTALSQRLDKTTLN
jgi:histone deacetylase 8